ncbi:MAG: FIST C-terminal domain-containing protein [Anaerolineales bacterium]|nr:FIST C-terminal domain-containing protein [Chloroflexota bacterium]MBL6979730.1 FIST C-terminal domain-containing protein [Anaerolineales bacterium]
MKIEQSTWRKSKEWITNPPGKLKSAQWVLTFGSREILQEPGHILNIRETYPDALIVGCSTAGEISGARVYDDSLVITAIEFEHTRVKGAQVQLGNGDMDSFKAGEELAKALDHENLAHVLVISEGTHTNGSDLVRGLSKHLPADVAITGGLAGDGANFEETVVFFNSGPQANSIVVVGFYGDKLQIGYGSMGGWDPFGPERLITRSEGNVLFELDDQSALGLYKNYLGDHAKDLPSSALLFPLSIRSDDYPEQLVRTILAVDDEAGSMTFAGDVPQGAYARFMKANFDRLVDGAYGAAKNSFELGGNESPDLAILISCVGRKLVLQQMVEDEVESVREVLGESTTLTGFYSYGEICPSAPNANCDLHNQTMTITTISEK